MGQLWTERIEQAIENCIVVVFLKSKQSIASPWVKRELMLADEKGRRIIPAVIDGDPDFGALKFLLISYHRIDAPGSSKLIPPLLQILRECKVEFR